MKRRPAPPAEPGALPAELTECWVEDWLAPAEMPPGRLSADDRERLEILAWGRFRREFYRWHTDRDAPRPYPMPRPEWRTPR